MDEDKKEEKIIDYLPTSKALGKKRWYFIWAAIAFTWAALVSVWFYVESRLSAIDGSGDLVLADKIDELESDIERIAESLATRQKMLLAKRPSELPDKGIAMKDNVVLDAVTRSELEIVSEKIAIMADELKKVSELKSELETEIAENKKSITERAKSEKSEKTGPLIMALTQVQGQVRKGLPFDKELQLVELQAKEDQVLQQHLTVLKAHGGHGVITTEMLRDRFAELAGNIVSEARKAEEKNLWDRTRNEFINIVSIRRVDDMYGDNAESIVARAEEALKNYNVTEAVLELDSLDDRPKEIVSEWLADASARVAVEYALDGILARITQIAVGDGEK